MPRRILEGNVVSDKMDKTVTVLVERRFKHPMYHKIVRRTDRFAAHDDANTCKVGDRVQIEECRPISKRKTWRVITIGGEAVKQQPVAKTEAKKPAVKKEEKPAAEKKAEEKKPAAKKTAGKKTTKATSKKKDESK